ncbi:MAG TPA: flagellin hook IN motif-containing protein, partial [Phycisphaerales bacterium]|nr:flagellin hook IN motif-containing protein [Phycisphaerales bacterium]
ASSAGDALNQIGDLLNELQGLVGQSTSSAELTASDRAVAQARIDQILSSIDRAEQVVRRAQPAVGSLGASGGAEVAAITSNPSIHTIDLRFTYSNVADSVSNVAAKGYIPPGGSRDVEIEVTASARHGNLYFTFNGDNINLGGSGSSDGASRQLVINVVGSKGSQQLSFASGTTLNSVVAAINTYRDATGVEAVLSGAGVQQIHLQSTGFGSREFVSVNVLDSGGIANSTGVYTEGFTNEGWRGGRIDTRLDTNDSYTRHGRDVQVLVFGTMRSVTTEGTDIRVKYREGYDVAFRLEPHGSGAHAQRRGLLHVATITSQLSPPDDSAIGVDGASRPSPIDDLLSRLDQLRADPSQRAANIAQLAATVRDAADRVSDARTATLGPRLAQFRADLSALFGSAQ